MERALEKLRSRNQFTRPIPGGAGGRASSLPGAAEAPGARVFRLPQPEPPEQPEQPPATDAAAAGPAGFVAGRRTATRAERQAQPPQSAERSEQLQVMNRLQELARRQQDLNERLKELQTALQEARTGNRARGNSPPAQTAAGGTAGTAGRCRRGAPAHGAARKPVAHERAAPANGTGPQDMQKSRRSRRSRGRPRRPLPRAPAPNGSSSKCATTCAGKTPANSKRSCGRCAPMPASWRASRKRYKRRWRRSTIPRSRNLSDADLTKETLEDLAGQRQRLTNLVDQATQLSRETEEVRAAGFPRTLRHPAPVQPERDQHLQAVPGGIPEPPGDHSRACTSG